MSLATPQAVTVNTVATDLNRISDEGTSSTYASADGALIMKVSHQTGKNRTRRMVRIDQTKIAADPLTAVNSYQKAGVYIVVDEPSIGFSDTELDYLVTALKGWMTTSNIAAILASRH